ncbi:antigen peptide transporter 2 [Triplophysa dalaica]|uniref:antigen peptide transporter 2 n=1 Tax=Triplophysa dalaica TaxID=1582913 RepID=UPI0024DF3CD4|nr:antigen peptide transporter 2 [Triplophysa dalaica]
MIPKPHSIISITTLAAHVYLLCCDLFLWACVCSVLLRLDGEGSLDLRCLWAFRLISWTVLYLLSTLVADSTVRPFLKQWVALLSFLPAVFDTVQTMLQGTVRGFSPVPDPGMVVLSSATSTLIYVVMETAFPHGGSVKGSRSKKKDEEAKALLMRVIRYSRPDYLHLGAAFIFLSLAALFETFIPYSIGKVVDHLSGKYQHNNFLWAIGLMALCSLGSSMFSGLRGGMFMCSLSRLNKRIRHMLFQNLMKQDINFFEENKPGSLTSRLISDTDKMGRSVAMNANVLLRSLVKTCGMLYFMLGLSWQLTLLTCIEMPLLAFIQNAYNNLYQKTSREIQDCNAEIADLATSVIGSMKTVRSCKGEAQEQRRYERALNRKLQVLTRKGISSNVHLLIRRFISVGLKVAMLIQGRNLISTGQLSSGSLLAFVFYQKDMVTNMKQLVYIYGDMLNTVGSALKVFQLLDRKPRMREEEGLAPEKLKGKLTFEKVTFSYSSRPDNKALESVTLELSPGKVTALVGPSGGGKTSCVCLLQRFYEPQDGEVFLDGKPLYRYQHQYFHQKVAMVSQDPVLFSGSVRYNIEYGLKDCTMERVKEAARKANAHDFIRNLEKEYDTDVGECGDQLSAGQKQCIALARALIRNPQILILDEATSHMDCSTQQAIQDVLNNITDQTVLVIAHRLETVEKAHHIIFMEDGKVVEEGTHQQLMANEKGRYYRLKEKLFQTEPDSRN